MNTPCLVLPVKYNNDSYRMKPAHSAVTMDVYNHIASRQDVKEEVDRYAMQNFILLISTHLLTVLTISCIVYSEQKK